MLSFQVVRPRGLGAFDLMETVPAVPDGMRMVWRRGDGPARTVLGCGWSRSQPRWPGAGPWFVVRYVGERGMVQGNACASELTVRVCP